MRTIFLELRGIGYPEDADVTQEGNERFDSATKIAEHRAALVSGFRARLCGLIAGDPVICALLGEHRIDRITLADASDPGATKRDGASVLELDWPW